MGDVTRLITDRCALLWGEHTSEAVDDVLDIYEGVLGRYSNEVLTEAFAAVAGEHIPGKKFPWPSPAIFKRACEAITAKTAPPVDRRFPDHLEHAAEWPVPTPESIARVNALVAEMKRTMAMAAPVEKKQAPMIANRDTFTGRYSPVFREVWHTETLAETIRKQDAARHLSERSRAMTGEHDE